MRLEYFRICHLAYEFGDTDCQAQVVDWSS